MDETIENIGLSQVRASRKEITERWSKLGLLEDHVELLVYRLEKQEEDAYNKLILDFLL